MRAHHAPSSLASWPWRAAKFQILVEFSVGLGTYRYVFVRVTECLSESKLLEVFAQGNGTQARVGVEK